MSELNENAVIYPDSIRTAFDRFKATYRLNEEARLFHNEIGFQARSDWPRYKGQWLAFSKIYHNKIRWLLHEQNINKERIRLARFPTVESWRELTDSDREGLKYELVGDKALWKLEGTLAKSPLLDKLRVIDLSRLNPLNPPDPNENFTIYTEEDPNSRITKTSSKVSFTALSSGEDAYVYKAGAWNGDFEHLLEIQIDAAAGTGYTAVWALTNLIDDLWGIVDASGDYLSAFFRNGNSSVDDPEIQIEECDGGTRYGDAYDIPGNEMGVLYYPKSVRDEAVGTYGTHYFYVYTNSLRTTLVATLTVTLHTNKKDYQNIHVVNTRNLGESGRTITGFIQNLDLQEAVAAVELGAFSQRRNPFGLNIQSCGQVRSG